MKRSHRVVPLALLLLALSQSPHAQTAASTPETDTAVGTAMDAELFYQLLLGEINALGTEPGAGYSLILDAARKTNDPTLYQRAVELAFEARSGDAALQAAQAWKQAQPDSREANRYVLQILIALNRVADSAEFLKSDVGMAKPQDRAAVLAASFLSLTRA